jgi:uncharacterized protein (TIGR02679 family)
VIDDQLKAWALKPGPAKILAVARRRAEHGSRLERGTLPVELSPAERKDVGALLGIDWTASGRDVSIVMLRAALDARGLTFVDLLVTTGPLRDRPAEKAATQARAASETADALASLEAAGIEREAAAKALARRGVPAAGSRNLQAFAADVATTWAALPGPRAERRIALAVLAGNLFDDPHALDRSTILDRTIARLALDDAHGVDADPTDVGQAETWRAAWAAVSVDTDTVSSMVLVLNLPLDGDAAAARLTQAAGPEPVWLTLRSLEGSWRPSPAITDTWVCENPTILEAAVTQLGSDCPPLVCTFGRPASAGVRLLHRLGSSGVRVHVRADDDRTGQSIVAQLLAGIPGAQPWRFPLRAANEAASGPRFEEQLLQLLLSDLADAAAM